MAATLRQPLSESRILDAALRIVDAEGLAALSMRRLGQELGVEAMSLYHHVPGKTALLSGVVELLLAQLDLPHAPGGDWRTRLRSLAHAYRWLAHEHPHAFPLIVMRDHQTPQIRRLLDLTVDICRDAGAEDEDARSAFYALAGYVSGYALFEIGGFLQLVGESPPSDADVAAVDAEGESCSSPVESSDSRFEFGLDALLVGLEAQFSGHATGAGRRSA